MQSERTIAVVGGNGRRVEVPGGLCVRWYPSAKEGGHHSARRVLDAMAAGGVDVVLLLVRWLGHPLATRVRAEGRRVGVPVQFVLGGRSSLRRALFDLREA